MMIKKIKFNENSALFNADNSTATLSLTVEAVPSRLADTLDKIEGINVNGIYLVKEYREYMIMLDHKLRQSELFQSICDAISNEYKSDIVVCHA